jgi:hypothetical protein
MANEPCDGCGRKVRIAGGIGDFWSLPSESTGGIELELMDGSEHFLCFDCLSRLPGDREVTAADVRTL